MSISTFIPKHEREKLDEELERIPWLSEQLGIAFVKHEKLGVRADIRKPKRPSEQPLPFREDAAELIEDLHHELVGWVRLVCEQRGVEFMPVKFTHRHGVGYGPLLPGEARMPERYIPTTPDLSRWMRRHLMSVALTEGAQEALVSIGHVIDRAQALVTPYRRDNSVDPRRLEAANEKLLSASNIATVAGGLDEKYRNLSRSRVLHLYRTNKVEALACHAYGDAKNQTLLFRLGDVLQQHLLVPIRQRHAVAA